MSLQLKSLATTDTAMDETPFLEGYNAIAVNQTASAITISDTTSGTPVTAATAPANGMVSVTLTKKMKGSAAINLLAAL